MVTLNEHRHASRPTHFNTTLLTKPDSKAAMLAAWNTAVHANTLASKGEQVVHGLKALRDENGKITKRLKKARRAVYQEQFKDVRDTEACLQSDWNDLQA
jgi:hypothetical protein